MNITHKTQHILIKLEKYRNNGINIKVFYEFLKI